VAAVMELEVGYLAGDRQPTWQIIFENLFD